MADGWQVEARFIRKTYPHKVAPECACAIASICEHRPCCYFGETVPENVRSILEPPPSLDTLIMDYLRRDTATTANVASHFGLPMKKALHMLLGMELSGRIVSKGPMNICTWEIENG